MLGSATRPSDLAKWTTIIISNEEMNNIMKVIKSLEESCLLIKGVSEAIKNEEKEQKGSFLSMLLGTLGVSLLGNLLAGKRAIETRQGHESNMPGGGTIRAGKSTIRAGQDF